MPVTSGPVVSTSNFPDFMSAPERPRATSRLRLRELASYGPAPGSVTGRRTELSGLHEREANPAPVVLSIRVDDHHALPRAQGRPAAVDGKGQRWRDERGQEVIPPVAGRPVPVAVPIVPGKQPFDHFGQIVLGP